MCAEALSGRDGLLCCVLRVRCGSLPPDPPNAACMLSSPLRTPHHTPRSSAAEPPFENPRRKSPRAYPPLPAPQVLAPTHRHVVDPRPPLAQVRPPGRVRGRRRAAVRGRRARGGLRRRPSHARRRRPGAVRGARGRGRGREGAAGGRGGHGSLLLRRRRVVLSFALRLLCLLRPRQCGSCHPLSFVGAAGCAWVPPRRRPSGYPAAPGRPGSPPLPAVHPPRPPAAAAPPLCPLLGVPIRGPRVGRSRGALPRGGAGRGLGRGPVRGYAVRRPPPPRLRRRLRRRRRGRPRPRLPGAENSPRTRPTPPRTPLSPPHPTRPRTPVRRGSSPRTSRRPSSPEASSPSNASQPATPPPPPSSRRVFLSFSFSPAPHPLSRRRQSLPAAGRTPLLLISAQGATPLASLDVSSEEIRATAGVLGGVDLARLPGLPSLPASSRPICAAREI